MLLDNVVLFSIVRQILHVRFIMTSVSQFEHLSRDRVRIQRLLFLWYQRFLIQFSGYIQEFLSARFWIPLGRLTYSAYLVHFVVIVFMFNALNGTMQYELTTVVSKI